MKSVFLSFIIFFVVFLILRSDILAVVSTDIFTYLTFGSFIIVFGCALYFVGLPKIKNRSPGSPEAMKENNDEK